PSHHPHPPFLFSHPPSTTPIYTLSLHDALPISIHRIASTYDVLPASVPLGRGVFVDGIRALDVTGDGIKEAVVTHGDDGSAGTVDRKSTRLNSSHVAISYAVFCLKKKK